MTIRAFLMQWLHREFEWYGRQQNPANCSVNLISSDGDKPYDHQLIFEGFDHRPTSKQDAREAGTVEG